MTIISVIAGGTCQGRFSEKPAQWIFRHVRKRDWVYPEWESQGGCFRPASEPANKE